MVQIDTKFSKPHASSQQKKKKRKKKSPNKSASFVMHPQHTTEEFCAVSIYNISKIQFALQQMPGMLSQGRNDN
jgi:hypothetical protein